MQLQLRIVGQIRTAYPTVADCPGSPLDGEGTSQIELLPEYAEALAGIEAASHLLLLYWLNEADRSALRAPTRVDGCVRGVFANRAPTRPNPIAIAAVKLLGREGQTLVVSGLDCVDRTPLLDIKPYVRALDSVPEAHLDWMKP
jgi:tRNA (adenine37-N6)-methyltransferase